MFLLITTLGGLAAGFVVYKFAPETSGSGIPYVKISLLKSGRLIRVRTIFVKFIAGVLGIGTGLSLGREGPSVQLGAGAGSFIGKIFKLDEHNRDKLIASGAGAAIGATFNAPIAGTLFVLEELIHRFTPSMLFPTLVATVVSASVARHFLGANLLILLFPILRWREVYCLCVLCWVFWREFSGCCFPKQFFSLIIFIQE